MSGHSPSRPNSPTASSSPAQLLVTLAWRLDGGQLVSADQLLARLCAIPANDVAISAWVGEASRDQAARPAIPQLPGQV